MGDSEVKTDHMPLACYLWFSGHELQKIEWSGNRCSWTFAPPANEDRVTFEQGMARVDPLMYYNAVSEFKNMVWKNNPSRR